MAKLGADITWVRKGDFFESSRPVPVPLLGRALAVSVDPEGTTVSPAQRDALHGLLSLPAERLDAFTHPVALACWYACQEAEIDGHKPAVRLRKRARVWRHVDLSAVLIPAHGKSRDRYVFLHGECAWDQEHGLELLLQNGHLLRVGSQDGLFCSEEWGLYFIRE